MFPYGARYLRRCTFLGLALLIVDTAIADSTTGQKYFDDANAAFRQGDFGVALASYNDALAHGKDAPRVFYNMGLAHFRLDQYEQAKWAFAESSKDEDLAALSFYQLGALAKKDGEFDEAVDWMRQARDTAKSEKLRRQSSKALAIMGVRQPKFDSSMSVGFGYDSNAFRSPDEPYIDLSGSVPTPVVPVTQSGSYAPIRIKGDYHRPFSRRAAFTTSYSFRGDFHTDAELQNADVHNHRLKIGGERKIGDSGSENRRIAMRAVYRIHGETNYDRDDGLDRFDDGQSIADRYDYQSVGAEVDVKNRIGSIRYSVAAGGEQRDYDDLPTTSSYDMTNYWIGGDVKFPLTEFSRLEFGYEYYVRDFDERRARDLSGDASLPNPTIEYQYHEMTAGLKYRPSSKFVGEIIYFHTIREDQFVDYNGYTRNKIRVATTFNLSDRFRTSIRIDYRDQTYANAFAFNNPTQAQKEYQELEAILALDYEFTDRLSLRVDLKQEIVESSDPRGEYDRLRGAISVHWAYD